MTIPRPLTPADERATGLGPRRDELLARLPRKIRTSRALTPSERELVVDDAMTYIVLDYPHPLPGARDLERAFWKACELRVRQALDGRHQTVRGRWQRAADDELDTLAGDADPAAAAERAEEEKLVREFAATLNERERRVLRVKYFSGTEQVLGYRQIAQQLGISLAAARAADRAIKRALERFAAVYTAGELCPTREIAISALAAGTADRAQALLAQTHVAHCRHCHDSYVHQLRAIRSAAFERKVAAVLPAVEAHHRHRLRGAWDAVADTLARPFTHDGAASSAAQLAASGAGRGAGTVALLKIAGACMASAGAIGICATTLVAPTLHDRPRPPKATSKRADAEPSKPTGPVDDRPLHGGVYVQPTPAATRTPTPVRTHTRTKRAKRRVASQDSTGPTAHERTPASPAPTNAAPAGQSEFDPSYQPSTPPAPAPAPAASGGREFF
jgi:RNA polymerase sigma factor (sigma-70 family)